MNKDEIYIILLIIFLFLLIKVNIGDLFYPIMFFNYKLKNKKYNIKSLNKPHIIVCSHTVGIEYIERQIINSEVKNSKLQVHLIVADTIYNKMYNSYNILSNCKYIYIRNNTVNKGVKSLKDNNHICTFYYKNQSRNNSGIYYMAQKSECPILLAKLNYNKNIGLTRIYSLEYDIYDYNLNDSKEDFLNKLSDKLFS